MKSYNILIMAKKMNFLLIGLFLCTYSINASSTRPSLELEHYRAKKYVEKKYIPRKTIKESLYAQTTYDPKRIKNIWIGSVLFKYGKAHLDPTGLRQSARVAHNLIRYFSNNKYNHPSVQKDNFYSEPNLIEQDISYQIKIIGYADTNGRTVTNLKLGLLRAEEVASQLDRLGIPMDDTIIASYGNTKSYTVVKKQHRVEILLIPKKTSNNKVLLYVILFFAMFFIAGLIFYILISQRRQREYRQRP